MAIILDKASVEKKKFVKRFYKEGTLWYIDLPEFINGGFGSKSDLLMVDGSDKMLDVLSRNTGDVVVEFRNYKDENNPHDVQMTISNSGLNQELLDSVGHAPIEYGRYYDASGCIDNKSFKMRTWLCPVAEWVFGSYPKDIYVTVVSFKN